jgi:hypothetical protein
MYRMTSSFYRTGWPLGRSFQRKGTISGEWGFPGVERGGPARVKTGVSLLFEVVGLQKKMMWIIFTVLSLLADFCLPLMWGIIATFPLFLLSWWIAYRSGWID